MNSIQAGLTDAIKDAMRAKDTVALTALRALKSAFLVMETAPGAAGGIAETEAVAVVRKQIKQREDSIVQFEQAGRTELADKEKAEIAVLERFLPKALSAEEIEALVSAALAETGATTKAQMGAVMKLVSERAAGQADGKTLSQAVMARLSGARCPCRPRALRIEGQGLAVFRPALRLGGVAGAGTSCT